MNEIFLEEKPAFLERAKSWSPRVISKLEAHIRTSDDEGLFRINPFHFASEKNLKEAEALDLFLYATLSGLFTMDWSLTCPTCGEVVESFKALKYIHANFACNLCRIDLEATLDDLIHVTFTISSNVRDIKFHRPEELSAKDYYRKYRFNSRVRLSNGMTFMEYYEQYGRIYETIAAGESRVCEVDVDRGWLVIADLENDSGCYVEVREADGSPNAPLRFNIERNSKLTEESPVRAGKLRVELANTLAEPSRVFAFYEPPEPPGAVDFGRVLTGKDVLSSQTFRDLFRTEVISSTEGLTVRDITILFTDLKGSTALYDRIGDLKAFALVRQHFDSLGRVIMDHHGAIVKTIGDAIMASFLTPADAVSAAIGMIDEIKAFNRNLGSHDVVLKLGIHRGASIAVTLNERLDYFGQMVDVASRVQGLADADEICVTEQIYEAPGVRELLGSAAVAQESSTLKGVQDKMVVYRVRPRETVAV